MSTEHLQGLPEDLKNPGMWILFRKENLHQLAQIAGTPEGMEVTTQSGAEAEGLVFGQVRHASGIPGSQADLAQ
jgi:uncharacterized UPF0160 family protein